MKFAKWHAYKNGAGETVENPEKSQISPEIVPPAGSVATETPKPETAPTEKTEPPAAAPIVIAPAENYKPPELTAEKPVAF